MGELKNLAAKMILVMNEVGYVQKDGRNDFQRYNYATESALAAKFSSALAKHGVFMFTSILERRCEPYQTRGGKGAFLTTVKLEVTFVDSESGESFVAHGYGDGSDSDDKGVYKAITGAQKYVLMKTFLVATGDDPEKDDEKDAKLVSKYTAKINGSTTLVALQNVWKEVARADSHIQQQLLPIKDEIKERLSAND